MLNKTFTAKLQRSPNKSGWTYLVWPGSVRYSGTRILRNDARKRDEFSMVGSSSNSAFAFVSAKPIYSP